MWEQILSYPVVSSEAMFEDSTTKFVGKNEGRPECSQINGQRCYLYFTPHDHLSILKELPEAEVTNIFGHNIFATWYTCAIVWIFEVMCTVIKNLINGY